MRLINVRTLDLEGFWGREPPPYTILSHTWGSEEVSFQEWNDRQSISHKAGYRKIREVAQLTESFDIDYVWVDTNCIDKSSSAELSEAINSMFTWYSKALYCFVHLDDVASVDEHTPGRRSGAYTFEALQNSRWFTRGWTLQELIAPACLVFFSRDWEIVGCLKKVSRGCDWPSAWLEHWFYISTEIQVIEEEIVEDIARITGIDRESLTVIEDYKDQSIAVRMHWASKRSTTRVEDMAYCLLGLFKINMPLLYGEGSAAFQRLQEEIMKVSVDQSIFAWSSGFPGFGKDTGHISLMAPWPTAFTNKYIVRTKASPRAALESVFTLTNFGLSIQLPLLDDVSQKRHLAVLECTDRRLLEPISGSASTEVTSSIYRLCIPLTRSKYNDTYSRVSSSQFPIALRIDNTPATRRLHIPRLGQFVCPHVCLRSCENRSSEGGRSYIFHIFGAPDQPVSYVRPLPFTRYGIFCRSCQRILINGAESVYVAVGFEEKRITGTRKRNFLLKIYMRSEENCVSLSCDFTYENSSFSSCLPGQLADKTRGRVELGLLASQWWGRDSLEIPIFLSFEKASESSERRETSKVLILQRDNAAGGHIMMPEIRV
ncbi:hypothetical protein NPX13_g11080 [Xylaria arbuscula]|uniref:Heterokaryon incompatibility domain-containing protein n=1 Tax=Xylaria arbuscula TaxID=114810 RepID=A0A9W8N3K5_9PEZI|nr:hypothetical protein NPX13_g11080 [Xylaria arbuscula]